MLDAVPPRSGISPGRLADEIGFAPREVGAALARLELLGLIEQGGQRIRRTRRTG